MDVLPLLTLLTLRIIARGSLGWTFASPSVRNIMMVSGFCAVLLLREICETCRAWSRAALMLVAAGRTQLQYYYITTAAVTSIGHVTTSLFVLVSCSTNYLTPSSIALHKLTVFPTSQEIPLTLCILTVHCHAHNSPSLLPLLGFINPFHDLPSYFLKIKIYNVLSKSRYSESSLAFQFPHQCPVTSPLVVQCFPISEQH